MKQLFSFITLLIFALTASSQTVTLSVNQSGQLQINAPETVFNILKGNQQILGSNLNISGGSSPYRVSWSSAGWSNDSVKNSLAVSPIDSTVYTCKVTDAKGCTTEQPFQVNVVFPIQLELVATQISCFGKQNGAINLDISGGAKPYTIAWRDGSNEASRTGLGAGTYTATVTDALNQQHDTTITLIEQSQIEVSITASVCEGSSYSFNKEELTAAGNYTATYQSTEGCDSVVSLSLAVNPVFETTETAAICQGETYTFAGKQLSITGQYSNKLQSATGCDSTILLNLTVNPLPTIPIITHNKNMLTSTTATSYQWWKDNSKIDGATDQTLKITSSGNYMVDITNNDGCRSQSATYQAIYTGISSLESAGFLCNVFPNPNNGLFTVELENTQQEAVQLDLISVDGKTIAHKLLDKSSGKQTVQFGKENLVKGIYTLRIQCGAKTENRKLAVN